MWQVLISKSNDQRIHHLRACAKGHVWIHSQLWHQHMQNMQRQLPLPGLRATAQQTVATLGMQLFVDYPLPSNYKRMTKCSFEPAQTPNYLHGI